MAVNLINDTDLKMLAGMTPAQLRALIAPKSVKAALMFRRDLQISLTNYSKKHPAIGRLDHIQGQVIGICRQIEMAARNAFTITYWRKIKAAHPNMILTEKVSRKHKIKTEWEKLLKAFSY